MANGRGCCNAVNRRTGKALGSIAIHRGLAMQWSVCHWSEEYDIALRGFFQQHKVIALSIIGWKSMTLPREGVVFHCHRFV